MSSANHHQQTTEHKPELKGPMSQFDSERIARATLRVCCQDLGIPPNILLADAERHRRRQTRDTTD
jgi:hypothetical protein